LGFGGTGGGQGDPFDGVDIVVHRNGEPDPCSYQRRKFPSEVDDAEGDGNDYGRSPASKAILDPWMPPT